MNKPTTPDLPATKPARRAHRTPDQWGDLIALHSESGLDVARFCEQHDVGVAGFYAWRRRLAEPAAAGDHTNAEPPRFVRLAATPDPSDELTAHFPGDVRLTLPASALRVLVAALREHAPC